MGSDVSLWKASSYGSNHGRRIRYRGTIALDSYNVYHIHLAASCCRHRPQDWSTSTPYHNAALLDGRYLCKLCVTHIRRHGAEPPACYWDDSIEHPCGDCGTLLSENWGTGADHKPRCKLCGKYRGRLSRLLYSTMVLIFNALPTASAGTELCADIVFGYGWFPNCKSVGILYESS